ncbi:MAG: preprotein translocase subunit SecG [Betaproteobacteria bacterium]|nr:preprotein translocase subunit SecG [Betaproteobacteria bacterium]
MLHAIVLTFHVIAAASVIGLVLLQHGKGADMGAAFGSGSSGSLFGASGSANFLSRSTAVVAAVFFVTSMGLTYLSTQKHRPTSVVDVPHGTEPVPATSTATTPATPPSQPDDSSRVKEIPK